MTLLGTTASQQDECFVELASFDHLKNVSSYIKGRRYLQHLEVFQFSHYPNSLVPTLTKLSIPESHNGVKNGFYLNPKPLRFIN